MRIDSYLAQKFLDQYSRGEIKKSIESGKVLCNGQLPKPRTMVKLQDVLEGEIISERQTALAGENIPVHIIYQDEGVIVVDKPVGMVVHPGSGNAKGTLVNALLGMGIALAEKGGQDRPGVVHRLDKDTSGLLILAKTNQAHKKLQEQFLNRTVSKTYLALVKGTVEFEEGHIDRAIGRHQQVRTKMAVSARQDARDALTYYQVLNRYRRATLLDVKIVTGRTHQIRVHFAHLKHPVIGDVVYGDAKDPGANRLMLHALKLEFLNPKDGKMMSFESEIPKDFQEVIQQYEKH